MAVRKKKITVSITPENHRLLKEYADRREMSVSAVLHLMLNKAFRKTTAG